MTQSPKRLQFYQAAATLRNPTELQNFLLDLCTPAELDAMADRWEVAQLLANDVPYRKIYETTGTSTATVTRVARAMADGVGYRTLLTRLKGKTGSNSPDSSQPEKRMQKKSGTVLKTQHFLKAESPSKASKLALNKVKKSAKKFLGEKSS